MHMRYVYTDQIVLCFTENWAGQRTANDTEVYVKLFPDIPCQLPGFDQETVALVYKEGGHLPLVPLWHASEDEDWKGTIENFRASTLGLLDQLHLLRDGTIVVTDTAIVVTVGPDVPEYAAIRAYVDAHLEPVKASALATIRSVQALPK